MSTSRDRITLYGLILLINVVLNIGLSVAKYYINKDDADNQGNNNSQMTYTPTSESTHVLSTDVIIPTETFIPTETLVPSITPTPTLIIRLDNNPLQYGIDKKAEEAFSVFQETPSPLKGTVLECSINYMSVIMNIGNGYEAGERAYGEINLRDIDGNEHRLIYPANRCFMPGDKLELTYYPFKDNQSLTNNQLVFITNMNNDGVIYSNETNYLIGEFMDLEGVIKLNGAKHIAPGE